MIYKRVYFNIQNNFYSNELKMTIFENKDISDDIDFLLDLCRDLITLLKKQNPGRDVPINREQLAKLMRIQKRIQ